TLFVSHTNDIERTVKRIKEIIDEVKSTDYFTEDMLLSEKRETIGDYLSSLNSPEYIANQYTKYYLEGGNQYEILDIIETEKTHVDYLTSINSQEYIANQYTKYFLDGGNLYEILDIIEAVTIDDVKEAFETVLDDHYVSQVEMVKNA